MSLSKKAVLEIQELSRKAESLSRGTSSERKQADVLCQRISTIRQIGLSTDEVRVLYTDALVESTSQPKDQAEERYRKSFDSYIRGGNDVELRDFLAGTQSIMYTEGSVGGYFVPDETDSIVYEANAQVDPVLDKNITSFTMTPGPTLQPSQISGYDLSTITAQIIGETTQQPVQAIPPVAGGVLRSDITFRVAFAASLEASQDVPDFTAKIIRAGATALARKIGQSVMDGRGGTDMTGITRTLSSTLSNAVAGKISLTDITNWFFSLDRFYRASAKCGWMMNDGAYKFLRNAVDSQNRPLLSVEDDREMLLGKPVFISPSLARVYSSIGLQGALIFGDLSHLIIRASRPTLQVSYEQSQHGIETGECQYIFRQRCDATYFDPSAGVTPPLTLATIS